MGAGRSLARRGARTETRRNTVGAALDPREGPLGGPLGSRSEPEREPGWRWRDGPEFLTTPRQDNDIREARSPHRGWKKAGELIESAIEQAIEQKQVTYDFHRQLEAATPVSWSGFEDILIKNIEST